MFHTWDDNDDDDEINIEADIANLRNEVTSGEQQALSKDQKSEGKLPKKNQVPFHFILLVFID